ncbi:MAG TPA: alpha/beta hydrolase [Thermoleophilaceae bacterium]|jgi:pimeloyl-ACP methyl ester carboxylesterase
MSTKHIDLSAGRISYSDVGDGPPIVFLHGLLVNSKLWRKVTPSLGDYRCIVPDLPLGSHTIPISANADVTPPGLARLILEFIEKLDVGEVTVVANDTGGALTQIAMTQPGNERIAGVVITPCDAFDNFLPPMFKGLQFAARVQPVLTALVQPLRLAPLRRLPLAFGWLTKRPIDDPEVEAGYVRPFFTRSEVRRDVARVLRGIDARYTNEAAERLPQFDRPVLLAWATEDKVFPYEHAQKLADLLPDARVEEIPDSYSFVPEDQPDRLAELIRGFVPAGDGSRSSSSASAALQEN